jgi:hypothetical protein
MARTLKYPDTVGFRTTEADRLKLRQLCEATGYPRGELLRLLIQLAQPTHLPCVRFEAVKEGAGSPA